MFWNYWWSLQSDWLLIVQFTHESHHFSKSQIAFLPGQWESFTKIQQPITFQGLFKINNQIVGKWLITFATFNKPAKYWINKILLQTKKPNIWTIECCSFKIEVIRGNWTLWHAIFIWNHLTHIWFWNHKFDFKVNIALFSVQLPSFIARCCYSALGF